MPGLAQQEDIDLTNLIAASLNDNGEVEVSDDAVSGVDVLPDFNLLEKIDKSQILGGDSPMEYLTLSEDNSYRYNPARPVQKQKQKPKFWDYVKANYKIADAPRFRGMYGSQAMFDYMTDEDALQKGNAIQAEKLKGLEDFEEVAFLDHPILSMAGNAASFIPSWISSTKEAAKEGAKMAALFASATFVGGMVATPGVPEEFPGSVAAGGFGARVGAVYGVIKHIVDVEGGNLYLDMIQNGVERKAAKRLALSAGAVIGLTEYMQINRLAGPLKKLIFKNFKTGVGKSILAKFLGHYIKEVGAQVTEEVVQKWAGDAAMAIGTLYDENPNVMPTAQDIVQAIAKQTGETLTLAGKVAQGAAVLNAPGAMLNTRSQSIEDLKKSREEAQKKANTDKTVGAPKTEDAVTGLTGEPNGKQTGEQNQSGSVKAGEEQQVSTVSNTEELKTKVKEETERSIKESEISKSVLEARDTLVSLDSLLKEQTKNRDKEAKQILVEKQKKSKKNIEVAYAKRETILSEIKKRLDKGMPIIKLVGERVKIDEKIEKLLTKDNELQQTTIDQVTTSQDTKLLKTLYKLDEAQKKMNELLATEDIADFDLNTKRIIKKPSEILRVQKDILKKGFQYFKNALRTASTETNRIAQELQKRLLTQIKNSALTDKQKMNFMNLIQNIRTEKQYDSKEAEINAKIQNLIKANEKKHTQDSFIKLYKKVRKAVSTKKSKVEATHKKALEEYLNKFREKGKIIDIKPGGKKEEKLYSERSSFLTKLISGEKVNFRSLSTRDLGYIYDDLNSLLKKGRTVFQVLQDERLAKTEEIKKEVFESIRNTNPEFFGGTEETRLETLSRVATRRNGLLNAMKMTYSAFKKWAAEYDATKTIPSMILLVADGFKAQGTLFKHYVDKLNQSSTKEELLTHNIEKVLGGILDKFKRETRLDVNDLYSSEYVFTDQEGERYPVTLAQLWGVFALSENEHSLEALVSDWGWDIPQSVLTEMIDALPKEHKESIQKIKNEVLNELFKESSDISLRLFNVLPTEEENYWPMMGVKELLDESSKDTELIRDIEGNLFSHMAETIRKKDLNSLKKRVGKFGRPELDFFKVLYTHLDRTIKYNSYAESVQEISSWLNDNKIKQDLAKVIGESQVSHLIKSINRQAGTEVKSPVSGFSSVLAHLRGTTTAINLGARFVTATQQYLSVTQAYNRLRQEKGNASAIKSMSSGFKQLFSPKAWKQMYNLSLNQRFRGKIFDREVRDTVLTHPVTRTWDKVKQTVLYGLLTSVDKLAAATTWFASMDQATDRIMSGENIDPVKYADQIVTETQPSSRKKDLASIMDQGEMMKLFTMFYTFFSNFYNQMTTSKRRAAFLIRKKGKVKGGFAALNELVQSYVWLVTLPAIASQYIRNPGLMDEDPEEQLKAMLKAQASYILGADPITRVAGRAILEPQFQPSASPAISGILRELQSIGKAAYQDIDNEEFTLENYLEPGVNITVGYGAGMPVRQIKTSATGIHDLLTGESDDFRRILYSKWALNED